MECGRHNLSFQANFCSFTPLLTRKIKIWKNVKNTCRYYPFTYVHHKSRSFDVWFLRYKVQRTKFFVILGLFLPFHPPNNSKNQNFEKIKKCLEILSFCTNVQKIMIISYTVPEIWHVMDVIVVFHLGQFFAFYLASSPKS